MQAHTSKLTNFVIDSQYAQSAEESQVDTRKKQAVNERMLEPSMHPVRLQNQFTPEQLPDKHRV